MGVVFWNIAGIRNTEKREMEEWDVVMMIETWIDKKG